MHIDYAKESAEYHQTQGATDLQTLKFLAIDQVLDLAEKECDDKIKSIVSTMKQKKGKYAKNTDKQRDAVAVALLNKFKTTRATLAAAFNVSEAEMFGDAEQTTEEIEGITFDTKHKVAFGIMSTFVTIKDSKEDLDGNTYKASLAALKSVRAGMQGSGKDDAVTVMMGGEIVAVTTNEAKSLELDEIPAKWYSTPSGRPSLLTGGKRVNVYLDAASLARAAEIGNGNVSEGIRIALKPD